MMTMALHPCPFLCFPQIFPTLHGFTTIASGDIRKRDKQERVFQCLGYSVKDRIWPEQTHGAAIAIVTANERGKNIHTVDGLLYRYKDGDLPVFLTVHTADCLPLLFVDPDVGIIGSAHTGWKGTVLHIAKDMVEMMETLGATKQNIRVALGPSICGSCYAVSEERATQCRQAFPDGTVVQKRQGTWTFDIRQAVCQDLLKKGIVSDHIVYDQTLCTYERQELFYSYRRDGAPLLGEMMGFISLQNMTEESRT